MTDQLGGFFGLSIGRAFGDPAEKQRRHKRTTEKIPTKRRAARTHARRKK